MVHQSLLRAKATMHRRRVTRMNFRLFRIYDVLQTGRSPVMFKLSPRPFYLGAIALCICFCAYFWFPLLSQTAKNIFSRLPSQTRKNETAAISLLLREKLERAHANETFGAVAEDKHVNCMTLKRESPLRHICVYSPYHDEQVSDWLRVYGHWEGGMQEAITKILKHFPNANFIDLGAYIGNHCLLAAALGRKSFCVEPFDDNLALMHRSISLNEFDKTAVTVIPACLSDRRGYFAFSRPFKNPGGSSFNLTNRNMRSVKHSSQSDSTKGNATGSRGDTIYCILLEDLWDFGLGNFKQAVLKVDVEGSERFIFNKETVKHLTESIDIPAIFMEWEFLLKAHRAHLDEFTKLFAEKYETFVLTESGEMALVSDKHWSDWPKDIVWLKREYRKQLVALFTSDSSKTE